MHRRIPLSVELLFEGSHSGEGRILEMSEGGLSFLTTGSALAQGDLIRIRVLDETGELQLDASVVYGAMQDDEQVFGVQFGSVTEEQREQVRNLLRLHRFRKFRNPLSPTA
jgi:hypothetical protein